VSYQDLEVGPGLLVSHAGVSILTGTPDAENLLNPNIGYTEGFWHGFLEGNDRPQI
jgi:hypothetical protein